MGKKFEYNQFGFVGGINVGIKKIIKKLNKLGEEGWEACGILGETKNSVGFVLLKREKE